MAAFESTVEVMLSVPPDVTLAGATLALLAVTVVGVGASAAAGGIEHAPQSCAQVEQLSVLLQMPSPQRRR
jgi:hypothetical protein